MCLYYVGLFLLGNFLKLHYFVVSLFGSFCVLEKFISYLSISLKDINYINNYFLCRTLFFLISFFGKNTLSR